MFIDTLGSDTKEVHATEINGRPSSAVIRPVDPEVCIHTMRPKSVVEQHVGACFAQGFTRTSSGQRIILLANTKNTSLSVQVEGASGGTLRSVDFDAGFRLKPYGERALANDTVTLSGFGVGLVLLSTRQSPVPRKSDDVIHAVAQTGQVVPPCVCKEQQYCAPLQTEPPPHEVFPFVIPGGADGDNLTRNWQRYLPWSASPRKITSAAWLPTGFGNESICQLHKAGVRVASGAGWGGLYGGSPTDNTSGIWRYGKDMLNKTLHPLWAETTLNGMTAGVDGLNWDLEGNEGVFSLPFAKGLSDSRFADGLTNVMALLKTGGLKRNKRFQMSFCAPIYINQTAYLASAKVRELDKHSERTIYSSKTSFS